MTDAQWLIIAACGSALMNALAILSARGVRTEIKAVKELLETQISGIKSDVTKTASRVDDLEDRERDALLRRGVKI